MMPAWLASANALVAAVGVPSREAHSHRNDHRVWHGFELAMITGALLAAADAKCIAVIDGFVRVSRSVARDRDRSSQFGHRCIFSHCSAITRIATSWPIST